LNTLHLAAPELPKKCWLTFAGKNSKVWTDMKIKDIKLLIKEYFSQELQNDESIPAAIRRRNIVAMLKEFAAKEDWYDEN
jgi:hypothetical protein